MITSPEKRGSVLKVMAFGCGGLILVIIIGVLVVGWFAKKKIDEAGGLQALSSQVMVKLIESFKPELYRPLKPADQERLNAVLIKLKESTRDLNPTQVQQLAQAVQNLSTKMQGQTLSEKDAQTFITDLEAIFKTPSKVAPTPQ